MSKVRAQERQEVRAVVKLGVVQYSGVRESWICGLGWVQRRSDEWV